MALFPTSKYQQIILNALGRGDIASAVGADDYFKRIGIRVMARREGRVSVPVVTLLDSDTSRANTYGEGEESHIEFEHVDLSKITQWMKETK